MCLSHRITPIALHSLVYPLICSFVLTNIFENLLSVGLHQTILKPGDMKNQIVVILGEITVYCIDRQLQNSYNTVCQVP